MTEWSFAVDSLLDDELESEFSASELASEAAPCSLDAPDGRFWLNELVGLYRGDDLVFALSGDSFCFFDIRSEAELNAVADWLFRSAEAAAEKFDMSFDDLTGWCYDAVGSEGQVGDYRLTGENLKKAMKARSEW